MKIFKILLLVIYFWLVPSMEIDENMLEEISNERNPEDMSDTLLAFRKKSFENEDGGTFLDPAYSCGIETWISENYIDSLVPIHDTVTKDHQVEQIHMQTPTFPKKSDDNKETTTGIKIKFEKKIKKFFSGKKLSHRLFNLEIEDPIGYSMIEITEPRLEFYALFGSEIIQNDDAITKRIQFLQRLNTMIELELKEIHSFCFHKSPSKPNDITEVREYEAEKSWKYVKTCLHHQIKKYHVQNNILDTKDLPYLVQKVVAKTILEVGRDDLTQISEAIQISGKCGYDDLFRYHSGLKLLEIAQRKYSILSTNDDLFSTSASSYDLETLSALETLLAKYEQCQDKNTLTQMFTELKLHMNAKNSLKQSNLK